MVACGGVSLESRIISESGLYKLVMRSDKPSYRRTFPYGRQQETMTAKVETVVRKLAVCCFLLLAVGQAVGDTIRATVVGIADGDTVTVLDSAKRQHKIRLMGIDAPEKAQAFGNRSKQSLSTLAYGQTVSVEWSKTDRYGRLVGKLLSTKGTDINLEQVKRGMAWHYKDYQREQPPEDRASYAAAEEEARESRRGLWAAPNPIAPWQFRRARRNGIENASPGDN